MPGLGKLPSPRTCTTAWANGWYVLRRRRARSLAPSLPHAGTGSVATLAMQPCPQPCCPGDGRGRHLRGLISEHWPHTSPWPCVVTGMLLEGFLFARRSHRAQPALRCHRHHVRSSVWGVPSAGVGPLSGHRSDSEAREETLWRLTPSYPQIHTWKLLFSAAVLST